ncbi:hypothetical protein ACROYT_G014103 [Oculina patagonica]
MSRGPYKRNERVLKDEQLLQTLREYTGRVENFEFQRLQEQQKLFAKFKQDVESRYPGSKALTEIHIKCGKCTRMVNRLRYHQHFNDNHWKSCKVVKSGDLRDIFSKMQSQQSIEEDEQSEIIHIDGEDKSYKSSEDEVSELDDSIDTNSDGFVNLEDLDPVVEALQRELQTGNLTKEHIFYKVIKNELEFTQKSGDARQQFSHDKDVILFTETLTFQNYELASWPRLQGPEERGNIRLSMERLEPSIRSLEENERQREGWLHNQRWNHKKSSGLVSVNCAAGRKWSKSAA